MAIEVTPLGFKKPDGQEAVRGGENVIADNAQTAQNLIAPILSRLSNVESAAFVGGGNLMEDPNDPGFFLVGAA